ncbi:MAG: LysR family transcriptional regulator [Clostridia bacterium]|nr:LysR family transcriptional regulator [Clostridia bacterium]
MNTKNLDTFITLTKYNSINAAADALFISSPALQQQINRLESEIGFKLFERGAAGIRLTPAGETFLDGVIKLRSDTESLLARCRETDSLNKCLRVGAILGLQPDLFPRVSGPFFQKYPYIVQKPVMESEEQLFSDLDRGALDVIEYFDCPRAHAAGRNFEPLFWEGRDCMMSPTHPLASRETLTLDDLAGQHIIVYRFDRLPGLREYVEKWYPDIRISEDPRVMDLYTVVRSFEDGHIGLVPPHVGSQFHPLRTIPLKMDMSWPVGLVYREPRSAIVNQFIEVAKQVFNQ